MAFGSFPKTFFPRIKAGESRCESDCSCSERKQIFLVIICLDSQTLFASFFPRVDVKCFRDASGLKRTSAIEHWIELTRRRDHLKLRSMSKLTHLSNDNFIDLESFRSDRTWDEVKFSHRMMQNNSIIALFCPPTKWPVENNETMWIASQYCKYDFKAAMIRECHKHRRKVSITSHRLTIHRRQ